MLAVVLNAVGLMIGLVKLADIPKKLGTLLAILIALTILPGVLMSAWSRMSLWQQIAVLAIAVVILFVLRPRHGGRNDGGRRVS
jgi:uncharacterized protein (DUF983 family)